MSQMQHPDSMDFHNQRKCVMLRDNGEGLSWPQIAERLLTLRGAGHHPSPRQCRDVYKSFSRRLGRRKYKYKNCGRTKWKVTAAVETFLTRKLLALRKKCICTSTTLQRELLRDRNIELECSTIRKILKKKGYRWLPRCQKPKYSTEDKLKRVAFSDEVLAMTKEEYGNHLTMAMDGVVVAVPPDDPTDRENFCRVGESHMWRKTGEAAKPELAGKDMYNKQVPYDRAVPLWGGIGKGGFGLVMFHARKKVDQDEWSEAVENGSLLKACKSARPDRQRGPWRLLCDNERFLEAGRTRAAHAKASVELWHIPPRSPDLNPVERFWGWLRKRLRAMDLADLKGGRRPVTKFALKARVRRLLQTQKAKEVAKNYVFSLFKTCEKVKRNGGAHSGA